MPERRRMIGIAQYRISCNQLGIWPSSLLSEAEVRRLSETEVGIVRGRL